jgi:hypothetical protein
MPLRLLIEDLPISHRRARVSVGASFSLTGTQKQ